MSYLKRNYGLIMLMPAAGLAFGLGACGSAGSSLSGAANGGTVTIGQVANPDTLNAPDSQSQEAAQILELITQTLYTLNPLDGGQTIVPELATGYTLSNGNRTWTFHLRHDVRFSNGQPMTSADVKFSLLNAKSGIAQGAVDAAIETITTPDRYRVAITTQRPDAALLSTVSYYSNGIIPANFGGKTAKVFWNHPVGTGPFKFQSWSYGVSLTLVKNPYYWQPGLPHLNSVVFKPVADDASRVAGLKAGSLEVIESPPLAQVPQLRRYPSIAISSVPGAQDDSLYINARSGPLSDFKVREALSGVINRQQIAQALLFGLGLPASAPVPLNEPLFGPRPSISPVDLTRARQLLAATPYAHGFSMSLITAAGNSLATSIGQVLQQEFALLGVKLTVSPTDQSEAITDLQTGNYQAMFVPDISGQIDPDAEAMVTPQYEPGELQARFNFPEMSKIALQAEQDFNSASRKALYERFLSLYVQPHDPIPVIYEPQVVAVSTAVHGFKFIQGAYNLTDATATGG